MKSIQKCQSKPNIRIWCNEEFLDVKIPLKLIKQYDQGEFLNLELYIKDIVLESKFCDKQTTWEFLC